MFNMFPSYPSLTRDPALLSLAEPLLTDAHLLLFKTMCFQ